MNSSDVGDLIPILQVAIGPVILISGVGLILLSMTNRLGRVIDRTRAIAGAYVETGEPKRPRLREQLTVLWSRAKNLRLAIAFAAISALSSAILVIFIFMAALWGLGSGWFIVVLFSLTLISLILALILFIHDINRSLAALRVELDYDPEIE